MRLNNNERRMWVLNDEGLYRLWKATHLSMANFLRDYRHVIDGAINRGLGHNRERKER